MGHGKDGQHTLWLIVSAEHHSAMGFIGDSRCMNQKVSWVFRDQLLFMHPTWQRMERHFL